MGIPHTESKIVDPITKKIVPLNTDGELCVRGPHVMHAYWNEEKKTEEAIDNNGWFEEILIFIYFF